MPRKASVTLGRDKWSTWAILSQKGGVTTDPQKIVAMQSWPIPTNVKQLRGFLGLRGYYRKFIKGYSSLSKPLTDLLKKNAFCWSTAAK